MGPTEGESLDKLTSTFGRLFRHTCCFNVPDMTHKLLRSRLVTVSLALLALFGMTVSFLVACGGRTDRGYGLRGLYGSYGYSYSYGSATSDAE